MGAFDGPDDLGRQLRDVERRLAALESAPRLKSAALYGGALEVLDTATRGTVLRAGVLPDDTVALAVYDDAGVERARFGELVGGGYGTKLNIGFDFVSFQRTTTSNVYTPTLSGSAPGNAGPVVSIATGASAFVLVGASVQTGSGAIEGGNMTYTVSGATSLAAGSGGHAFLGRNGSTPILAASIVAGYLHTNLTPGVNVFTAQYLSDQSTVISFQRRFLIVLPI